VFGAGNRHLSAVLTANGAPWILQGAPGPAAAAAVTNFRPLRSSWYPKSTEVVQKPPLVGNLISGVVRPEPVDGPAGYFERFPQSFPQCGDESHRCHLPVIYLTFPISDGKASVIVSAKRSAANSRLRWDGNVVGWVSFGYKNSRI
jgi:hypothetical protein